MKCFRLMAGIASLSLGVLVPSVANAQKRPKVWTQWTESGPLLRRR
jgi:hypothetical protein